MRRILPFPVLAAALATAAVAQPAPSPAPPAVAPILPEYSQYARLVLAAPVIADATIRDAARVDSKRVAGIPAGVARFYVTADVTSLIRSPSTLPARLSWLVDVPLDARGRAPRLERLRVLAFARPLPGRPAELQLVFPDAQQPWSPGADARTRAIAQEVVAPAAPPVVTGVGNAFHVAGTLPGEGETQIFLPTADNRPVSLSILSRPGMAKSWTVALSEIVDEAAAAPARDTLLWYRLACFLPPELPASSVAASGPDDAAAARADYRFVIEALGPCPVRAVP